MQSLLLHNPWVRFYLLYATVLLVVYLRAYLLNQDAVPDEARAPRKEVGQQAPPSSGLRPPSPLRALVSTQGPRSCKAQGCKECHSRP
jgi:hypothetical protein